MGSLAAVIPLGIGLSAAISAVAVVAAILAARRRNRVGSALATVASVVLLVRRLAADGRISWWRKAVIGFPLLYVISPVQLLPNFIPVVGQLDDFVMLVISARLAAVLIPLDVLEELWPGDRPRLFRRRRRIERGGQEDEGLSPDTTQDPTIAQDTVID